MAYGVKYTGSGKSIEGPVYTVEILEKDFVGAPTTIMLGTPPVVVTWGQQGADVHEPLQPSTAEIVVFDKDKILEADINNADEEKYRLHVKKDSADYWLGKIITDGFEDSLDLQPGSTKISAIDGLGQLEGTGFEDTERVSIVQCVADILVETGLDLNIRFASNWFTPDILSSEDPLSRIYTDRLAQRGDNGEILSTLDVIREYLTRYGLQLFQDGCIWRVIQRELLKESSYQYFEYDKDGAYVTDDVEVPSVTITESEQYRKRLKGGRRPYKAAFKTATALYVPKPGQDNLVLNGSFENWTDDLPDGWTATDDLGVVSSSPVASDGDHSASLIARYSADPNLLPTDCLAREVGLVSGGLDALHIRWSSQAIKNPSIYTPPASSNPRKAYIRVLYGDYYVHRASDGTISWVAVGQGAPGDDYILVNRVGCSAQYLGWQDDVIVTPPVPIASGQLRIELYPLVEFEYTPGHEQTTAAFIGILYDNIIVLPISVSTGLKTVATSVVLPNSVNRDSVQFRIGDGPNISTPSYLSIGDTTTLTGNWKRGAYSGEDPTGKSLDGILVDTWLRAQKQPLEMHIASYTKRSGVGVGAVLEPHNVLVIGTKRYAFTYLQRDLIGGKSSGEWIEIRADDSDTITTTEAIVDDNGTNVVRRDTKYGDSNVVGSETFASGFAGSGWRIEKIGNRYKFFIDDLEVRGGFTASEFTFQQKRVVNGSLFVGRCGVGRAESMTKIE